jgi:uncharacterized integral membrane protein
MKQGKTQLTEPGAVVRRTRVGVAWVTGIVAALVLVLLLVFVIQNSQRVNVSFLGAHGHLPLGVALLLAAASGVLLIAVPGSARIIQLRRVARKAASEPPPAPPGGPVSEAPTLPEGTENPALPLDQRPWADTG